MEKICTCIILGIDVKSYSKKTPQGQLEAQKLLDQSLSEVLLTHYQIRDHEIPGHLHWVDAGDGGFLVSERSEKEEAIEILTSLCKVINASNSGASDSDSETLFRYALHVGELALWSSRNWRNASRASGDAINVCARLLSGMNPEPTNYTVCSDDFHQLNSGYTKKHYESEEIKPLVDKHNNLHRLHCIWQNPHFGQPPSYSERLVLPN